jgi:hypothetical protein
MKEQNATTSRSRQQQQRQQQQQQRHLRTAKSNGKRHGAGQQHHDQLVSRRCALPAPVSVEMYNVFPFCSLKQSSPSTASSLAENHPASSDDDVVTTTAAAAAKSLQSSSSSSSLFSSKSSKFLYHHRRPEHSSSLLHAIRLEIVIRETPVVAADALSATDENVVSNKQVETEERVLLSRIDDTLTVRPTWHHLNEGTRTTNRGITTTNDCRRANSIDTIADNDLYEATLDYRKYESMFFRFSVVAVVESKDNVNSSKSNILKNSRDKNNDDASCCFLSIPAHPSKLIRIWNVDGNNAIISGSQLLPPNLPINVSRSYLSRV